MKRALISDIHANLEALQAVMADIRTQGITEIYCLGDIVGYGPNPCECLDEDHRLIAASRSWATTTRRRCSIRTASIRWLCRPCIGLVSSWRIASGTVAKANRRWDFLGELPRTYVEDNCLYVHGSPREPTNEYVFPEDVYNQRKMDAIFGKIERYCFAGHTHIPGVFTQRTGVLTPDDVSYQYRLSATPVMINVGSVGQPRDNDPRACYVVLENDVVTFRRVAYDFETTVRKIYRVAELDNMLGDRLRSGR